MTVRPTFVSRLPQVRLALFFLALLVVPALLMRSSQGQAPFDESPLVRLREERPEYVFLGDSMLDSRIDGPYLSELLDGRPVTVMAPGGSATARWYLALKNYVIPSGVRPRLVFLFFRDRYFSLPRFRTEGRYRSEMEAEMRGEEPVVQRLIDNPASSGPGLHQIVERAYPIMDLRGAAREDIQKLAARLASSRVEREALIDQANASFGIRHLRADLPTELVLGDEEQAVPFSASPDKSFLPHLLELADQHGLRLCLVRVKRRPNEANVRTQDADLRGYVAALERYVESNGHYFYDETDDATLTLATYQDGDHLRDDARRDYTLGFRRRLAPLLQ